MKSVRLWFWGFCWYLSVLNIHAAASWICKRIWETQHALMMLPLKQYRLTRQTEVRTWPHSNLTTWRLSATFGTFCRFVCTTFLNRTALGSTNTQSPSHNVTDKTAYWILCCSWFILEAEIYCIVYGEGCVTVTMCKTSHCCQPVVTVNAPL